MFRSLLKESKKGNFYFIKDGVVNSATGGFSTSNIVSSGGSLVVSEETGYVRVFSGIWCAGWLYTNNSIPFKDYSYICFDINTGSQIYSGAQYDETFELHPDNLSDNKRDRYGYVECPSSNPQRKICKIALPSPVPSTMTKFYAIMRNVSQEIKIYNMWLE